jgi:hypothetical protein
MNVKKIYFSNLSGIKIPDKLKFCIIKKEIEINFWEVEKIIWKIFTR